MNRVKDFMIREKQNILWVTLGIYGSLSLGSLLDMIMSDVSFPFSILAIPVFALVFFFLRKFIVVLGKDTDAKARRRRLVYALVLGSLFGASLLFGYRLQLFGYTPHGVWQKIDMLLSAIGIGVSFMPFIYFGFKWLDGREKDKEQVKFTKKTSRNIFLISWAIIFAVWIPALLAYYPAIMSYDCNRQFQEAYLGYEWFNSHHPLVHTFLIRMFLLLGESLGSYQVGMALYSIVQMLVLSVVFAYACNMIGRLINKKWVVAVTVAFFAFLPLHQVLAVCVTKDILFTAFFLLFCLLVLEYNRSDNQKAKWLLLVAMLLTGVATILFRNNAIYAFAVFAVFYIICSKIDRIKILVLCVAVLLGGKFGAQGIQSAMNAGSGSEVEMYSVFLHQFARVGLYQNDNLDIEEYGIINQYVDAAYWNEYNPTIADGIKGNVAVTTFQNWKDDIPAMLGDWAKIGLRYPNDYIDAFLELTRGYWFLDDVSHAEVLGYGDDTNWGLIYTANLTESSVFEGVKNDSVLPGLLKVYQKIVNGNSYYDWPVLSMLFKPAFYCWMLIVIMISLFYMKQKRKVILCLFPFMYLLTLLLGPVVNFRYIYPIMVVVPVLVAWMFSNCDWKIKDDKKIAEK